ncbi:hypothetical protein [Microbispora sp. NPDC049633]|uniref:hypothetical protein n=1 Tax=Microbispora sp. NPDC049633 TaxID=3154355 RepID=UPI0034276472
MHVHGFTWTGPGADLDKFGERYPAPPQRLCDWLLRPRRRQDPVFADPAAALDWAARWYREVEPRMLLREQEAKIGLDFRLANAAEGLADGRDTHWTFWLTNTRIATISLVCCPHRDADHPCPAR